VTRRRFGGALLIGSLLSIATPGWPEPRAFDLAIRNNQLPSEQRTVRVRQGDEVTLRWTTDAPLTIHLHGYDIETLVSPGPAVVMKFSARATGRFPIEIHGRGVERTLGYLEVHPR
jgi:FtsP/CotA-like multicopper oxidase with cupredoxin domain